MPAESTIENYLKAIWAAHEWTDRPVTVTVLTRQLGLAASSVSEVVRKLADRGLVAHAPYGAIELTDEGRRRALRIVRTHRLIETFLVDYLGYSWDEVHDDAELLEHAASARFVERLAARLGDPERDPHGDPIPRADGSLPRTSEVPLAELAVGEGGRVARVWDDEPDLLRHLERLGVTIGARVRVTGAHPAAGTLDVAVGAASASIGLAAARVIRVEPLARTPAGS